MEEHAMQKEREGTKEEDGEHDSGCKRIDFTANGSCFLAVRPGHMNRLMETCQEASPMTRSRGRTEALTCNRRPPCPRRCIRLSGNVPS